MVENKVYSLMIEISSVKFDSNKIPFANQCIIIPYKTLQYLICNIFFISE